MADITIKTTDPDKILLTMDMTMPLKDWAKLRRQLSTDYPSWELGIKIRDAVERAQLHYTLEDRCAEQD